MQPTLRRTPITKDLSKMSYSHSLCPFENADSGHCLRGIECPMSHSLEEASYHPSLYKTKLCPEGI